MTNEETSIGSSFVILNYWILHVHSHVHGDRRVADERERGVSARSPRTDLHFGGIGQSAWRTRGGRRQSAPGQGRRDISIVRAECRAEVRFRRGAETLRREEDSL